MGYIVFSDMDGTLLNSELTVSKRTLLAIQTLQERGIPFVINSARAPSGIEPILNDYCLHCPVIACGGALILDENKTVLLHQGILKNEAQEIIDFIEDNKLDTSWSVFSLDQWIVKDKSDKRIMLEESIVRAQAAQGTPSSVADEIVNKILCICSKETITETETRLRQAFPHCSVTKSTDDLLEIMKTGVNKASGIAAYCALKGIAQADAVAFGDHYNDVEMLKAAGHGFLMDNAPAKLKTLGLLRAKSNNEDGIYHALKEMKLI